MNNKLKTAAALLAAVLMLAGCGSASSSGGSAEAVSKAAESQAAAESKAEDSESKPDDVQAEGQEDSEAEISEAEQESVPEEESLTADESTPEDASTDYEKLIASIAAESKIQSAEGDEVSFTELRADGLANVIGEGKAYALVFASGGAGNLMYDVYHTTDGGATWEKGDPVSIFNGKMSRIALEDGRLLLLDSLFAADNQRTEVYAVSCSEEFNITVSPIEGWTDALKFTDVPLYDEVKPVIYQAEYAGGYTVKVRMCLLDEVADDPVVLAETTAELDPETLAVK